MILKSFIKNPKNQAFLKKMGFAGFMFFLIKGLIWLAIFFFGAKAFF